MPYPTFLLECLLSPLAKSEIIGNTDSGTILNSLNVRSIPKLRLFLPPVELISAFESLVRPIRARMEELLKEQTTLTAFRDTLLPKLISDELRVPDAEALVAEAGI
jgi:hypothetical protein